jgi:molybdenum cofactor cytidylyltransferase
MSSAANSANRRLARGLILASGTSNRFGASNKLLARVGSETVIERTLNAYLNAMAEVWVVVAPSPNPVADLISIGGVHLIENPDFAAGQSAALRHGIRSLPPEADGAVIGVGDQPLLPSDVITDLIRAWSRGAALAVAPRYAGMPGNPVVFDRALFSALMKVEGDIGGRNVLWESPHIFLDFAQKSYALDIDTVDDLDRARILVDGPVSARQRQSRHLASRNDSS